jgi:hypothetical protein
MMAKQFDKNTVIMNFDKDILVEAYTRLKTYSAVAKEFNCAKSTIAKYFKKYNQVLDQAS